MLNVVGALAAMLACCTLTFPSRCSLLTSTNVSPSVSVAVDRCVLCFFFRVIDTALLTPCRIFYLRNINSARTTVS